MDFFASLQPAVIDTTAVPTPFVQTTIDLTAVDTDGQISSFIVLKVFLAALLTCVTTALGALPFLFYSVKDSKAHDSSSSAVGLMNSCAAGMMLGASITLIFEGVTVNVSPLESQSLTYFGLGMIFGVVIMVIAKWALGSQEVTFYDLRGASARRTILIIGVMFLHSFAEGVSIGVSFGGTTRLATLITASLAIHNVPEGLAVIIHLLRKGVSLPHATAWSVITSIPQPLMAVPAFLCVSYFRPFLPFGLGFAGSAMLWVTFTELIPEARADVGSDAKVIAVAGSSLAAMLAFGVMGGL